MIHFRTLRVGLYLLFIRWEQQDTIEFVNNMNLFNKKLLAQHVARYTFPQSEELQKLQSYLSRLQAFIKDEDLNRTQEIKVQGTFLVRVFSDVLGYSVQLDNNDQWTLEQHPRTEVDAQVADGGLGIFSKENKKYIAVIELKDAKTSLDKKQSGRAGKLTPVEQAFQYLNKFDGCKWAIVSNFREIRIYSKLRGQGFYEKFDIVSLTQEHEFKRFYYILNKHNLIDEGQKSVIDHLVEDTTAQEENITKKFYEHYKEIRLKVLNHLFEHNPEVDRLVLVEKTQKLLDRLIFTMVCEDSSTLLPAHLVKNTYDRAFQSFALSDSDERVWTEFKGLFHAIDKGNKRVLPPINAYNGGLFKADDILDSLIIKDSIWEELIKLTTYDFESDLNVNVLGHIFEQSISDLEEIRESVYLALENDSYLLTPDGEKISLGEKSAFKEKKGTRKKMGIFYTPEYITKYIVENTVGKYLEENPEKLESIKILDPACGSGAFLNQAHSFLLSQYKIRDEEKQLELQRQGKATGLFDLKWVENDKSILLNNLFGVDLSPESVEITKLALWLKTAKATEPLQNLDNNIKCGNSLIDDPEIAGKRAFSWNQEYQQVMENGGFDVIIGNPPYIFARNNNFSKEEKDFYYSRFDLTNYQLNTYILFIEQAYKLLNEGGYLGYIVPNTWLTIESFSNLRKFVLEKVGDLHIINIFDKVFTDASVDTCILLFKKSNSTQIELSEFQNSVLNNFGLFEPQAFNDDKAVINMSLAKNSEKMMLMKKIDDRSEQLSNFSDVVSGFVAYETGKGIPPQTNEIKQRRVFHADSRIDSTWNQYLEGKDVGRYFLDWSGNWIKYGEWLAAPRKVDYYLSERILVRQIPSQLPLCVNATYVNADRLFNDRNSMIVREFKVDPFFLLSVLNSKLTSFWFANKFDKLQRKTFPQFKIAELKMFPIPKTDDSIQQDLANLARKITKLNTTLLDERKRLFEILSGRLKIKPTGILTNFYQLGWNEFVTELEKQKIKLELSEQDKLNNWFNKVKKSLLDLEKEIKDIDQKIDTIIYNLYDLNGEEISLIENHS